MPTVRELLRASVERRIMTSDVGHAAGKGYNDLATLRDFSSMEELCRNRLIMGYFRYQRNVETKGTVYDNVGSTIKRLQMYQETGNAEHLVDGVNLLRLEFVQENHPNFHFEADDDGYHTEEVA